MCITADVMCFLPYPSVGRYCEYQESLVSEGLRDNCGAFGDYFSALNLSCSTGESGVVIWTPDKTTPDTVYYQVCVCDRDGMCV